MRLPNFQSAVISPAKVRDYLLSPTHPVGRTKARFFIALGFRHAQPGALAAAILRMLPSSTVDSIDESEYGRKFEVIGTLTGPTGLAAPVISVWIVRCEEDFPRLVTVFPEGR